MVGIVVVSHSAELARGVVELARQMAGPDVALVEAGGTDLPDAPLGTDAAKVAGAIVEAAGGDGVLVLMDLGSAVLSAELALDLLEGTVADRVLLCEAPLVEGAVSAATAARLGRSLDEVAGEARSALAPKAAHLGAEPETPAPASSLDGPALEARLPVGNPLGLHARPAVRFVQTVGGFDAEVEVRNATTGAGPASGRSLNAVSALGARHGHELLVRARGPQAEAVLTALEALATEGYGDVVAPVAPGTTGATTTGSAAVVAGALAFAGVAASPGLAVGPARLLHRRPPPVDERAAGDPRAEWAALMTAITQVRADLAATRALVAGRAGEAEAGILDAHVLLLDDDALLGPARQGIDTGASAAAAWSAAVEGAASAIRALEDEYQRARAADVADVGDRVLARLAGAGPATLEGEGVVVAVDVGPAEAASFDPDRVRAIATSEGGPLSHAVILARALGIPAVVGLGPPLLAVAEGDLLLVDGDRGVVVVDPPADLLAEAEARRQAAAAARAAAAAAAAGPARTADGTAVEVAANARSVEDVVAAVAAGADGVGLLRTEFLFLDRPDPPSEDEQVAALRAAAEALAGRPLTVRTLDAGADKPLPYLPDERPEANPALGLRGIRRSLAHPDLLAAQLRAVLRVAADHSVRLMFPMVTTSEEVRRARAALEEARSSLAAGGVAAGQPEVGIMVEVPAAALAAAHLAAEVDFFSIGTNDLTQYTLAVDRGNAAVAALADGLHPAVLRLVGLVCEAARARGRWVGVCGELASDPAAVPVLLGLGVTELSVAAPAVAAVKQAVRAVHLDAARALAASAQSLDSAAAVRALPS